MQKNVLSWKVANQRGFNPCLFPYSASHIPGGEFDAVLECKIWAKKVMAICSYFIQADTGKKFQLTVYRQPVSKEYMLNKSDINFAESPIGYLYHVSVLNDRGKIFFENASVVK